MSGYSKTPLAKKLGYREGMKIHLIGAPEEYAKWVSPLPEVLFPDHPPFDLIHIFTNSRPDLEGHLRTCRDEISPNGMIWISWHKKASRRPSEITEDTIRDIALPMGLVDIKVCSVTDIWSGLKVVIRKELR